MTRELLANKSKGLFVFSYWSDRTMTISKGSGLNPGDFELNKDLTSLLIDVLYEGLVVLGSDVIKPRVTIKDINRINCWPRQMKKCFLFFFVFYIIDFIFF